MVREKLQSEICILWFEGDQTRDLITQENLIFELLNDTENVHMNFNFNDKQWACIWLARQYM